MNDAARSVGTNGIAATDAGADAADAIELEPDTAAAPTEVATQAARLSQLSVAVGIMCAIAVVAALYLARAFFVPLLLGILASYALRPVLVWLQARHLPSPLAATLIMAVLVGSLSWIAFSLRDEATTMIEQFPHAARKLRQNLSAARTGSPTALQNMQEAANEIQGAATDAGAKVGTRVMAVKASEPSAWLRDYALAQSALLFTVAAQMPMVLMLTYFLLASGSHFRRKLVSLVGPTLTQKKDAVRILDEVDVQIQRYLFVMLTTNALVAVCTWLAFKALGLEQAGVWGVAAGVLHFIPYLGPVLTALFSGVAAFLQFDSLVRALAVAGVSLLVAGAIGSLFMTWLQSRFARVNAAVLFIALLFFAWLWGVWGLLLGGPLVAIVKVICDRVESLKKLGELLGQ